MRKLNNSIKNDEFWKGRFIVRCKESYLRNFDDLSGCYLFVRLRFIDNKTGKHFDVYNTADNFTSFGGSKLFWLMNDIINNHFETN